MKRIFTLLTACTLTLAATSQTYFSDDFENASLTANAAWTVQSVSNPSSSLEWVYGTFDGSGFAKCSNWDGSDNLILDTWLISPAMDLSSGTAIDMSFDMTKRYGNPGDDMKVLISTDYSGTGLPSTGTWTDITNLFTMDSDNSSWDFVGSGTGDISTYNNNGAYIAFQYTGSASDGSTWEVDNVAIVESGTVVTWPALITTEKSIYDIQYTTDASGDSPEKDNIVTTKGVVTGIFQIGDDVGSFFIQDGDGAYNGIYVFETGTTVQLGDSVLVTGKVSEFFSLTELTNVTDITIVNSGNALPTPVIVTSSNYANEDYEGVLVKVENTVNTSIGQFGQWTVNKNGDILIDDDLMASFTPVLGNGYDVTGVVHLSFDESKIYPRNAVSDIITVGYASINENELELSVYPNPANENVTISGIENGNVTIFAVNGSVVYNGVVNGTTTINVNDFTSGFYTIEVVENGLKANYKLMVK